MVIHKNEHYSVVAIDLNADIGGIKYPRGYAAVNNQTGVAEYQSPTLPDVLYTSEHLNQALVSKAWEWRQETAAKQAALPFSDLVN